jgi:hypothetical protein
MITIGYVGIVGIIGGGISLDFAGGLPRTRKEHDYMFVVVVRFSKMCILTPCKKTINGKHVTNMFFEKV